MFCFIPLFFYKTFVCLNSFLRVCIFCSTQNNICLRKHCLQFLMAFIFNLFQTKNTIHVVLLNILNKRYNGSFIEKVCIFLYIQCVFNVYVCFKCLFFSILIYFL